MTNQPIFYVDCFAGKGMFDDGNPGSPIIALQARQNCLNRTIKENGKIDLCFIDLYYAEELNSNLIQFPSITGQPHVVSGKYEDTIEDLLFDKRDYNVFLYLDPYGIKALDSTLFDRIKSFGFHSLEMLINFNSFGFFRDACRVMKVNYQSDKALSDLSDLPEFEPTIVDSSLQSEELLTCIAGGDYWKNIVEDYKTGIIDGYQAERNLSEHYKHWLQQRYDYVLDMPIRLKPGHRPKYRMIHVCDHEDGCFLMAQNMQKRKDELFIDVQQKGQLSLFDASPTVSSSMENELITEDQIKATLIEHLSQFPLDVNLTKFLATFVNSHGVLCEFSLVYGLLEELKNEGIIEITRNPEVTPSGKISKFWEESKGKKVLIRRSCLWLP